MIAKRVRSLNNAPLRPGAVVYWMSREIRSEDNWALLYSAQKAKEWGTPLYAVYNLDIGYLGGGQRQHMFKVGGLQTVHDNLAKLNIPFAVLSEEQMFGPKTSLRGPLVKGKGNDEGNASGFVMKDLVEKAGATLVVTDFTPLRKSFEWEERMKNLLQELGTCASGGGRDNRGEVAFQQVDAHNVVPCWIASEEQEYSARTMRPKLRKKMEEYLTDFPKLSPHKFNTNTNYHDSRPLYRLPPTDFELLRSDAILQKLNARAAPVDWILPGENEAKKALDRFIGSITGYNENRNNPHPDVSSGLSPYLHYGMLAPQRALYEAWNATSKPKADRDKFIDECYIRRELADNFCFYRKNDYDKLSGAPDWARKTLEKHREDKRHILYTREQLETAQTHDPLWNAAQMEMCKTGKMFGYVRMYWAKKLLEWSKDPEEALANAIYLNDLYELDGRDPNGYVGCMWAICAVTDEKGGPEREIVGTIRYMSLDGHRKWFDVEQYCARHLGAQKTAPSPGGAASTPSYVFKPPHKSLEPRLMTQIGRWRGPSQSETEVGFSPKARNRRWTKKTDESDVPRAESVQQSNGQYGSSLKQDFPHRIANDWGASDAPQAKNRRKGFNPKWV